MPAICKKLKGYWMEARGNAIWAGIVLVGSFVTGALMAVARFFARAPIWEVLVALFGIFVVLYVGLLLFSLFGRRLMAGHQRAWATVGVVLLVCLVLVTWLGALVPEPKPQNISTSVTTQNQPVTVSSHNQQGGITAHSVTVFAITNLFYNGKPYEVALRGEWDFQNKLENGKYISSARLVLDSPFPIRNFYFAVRGATIERMGLVPLESSTVIRGNTRISKDLAYTNLPNTSGKYLLTLVSTSPDDFKIETRLE